MKYLMLVLISCVALASTDVRAGRESYRNQRFKPLRNSEYAAKFLEGILNDDSIEVPDELDWRKVPGRISEVKDQGDSKSSWAFATIGVLEGQEFRRGNGSSFDDKDLIELSAQNLIDCLSAGAAIDGHSVRNALDLVKSEGGIDDEKSHPFSGEPGKCHFNKNKVSFNITGSVILPHGDEEKLKQVVAKFGPVAAMIDGASNWFRMYEDGIYFLRDCKANILDIQQGVLIVGYGRDKSTKKDYWILKNSFGADWGEGGYMRLARNRYNHCGIASAATIPTF